jgi:hypothetical protein
MSGKEPRHFGVERQDAAAGVRIVDKCFQFMGRVRSHLPPDGWPIRKIQRQADNEFANTPEYRKCLNTETSKVSGRKDWQTY